LEQFAYTYPYWFGWILFPKSFASERPVVIFRNSSFAVLFSTLVFAKRRAQASGRRGV
jgi:hypothetical protein